MALIIALLAVIIPAALTALLDRGQERSFNEYCALECAGYPANPRKSGYNGYMY